MENKREQTGDRVKNGFQIFLDPTDSAALKKAGNGIRYGGNYLETFDRFEKGLEEGVPHFQYLCLWLFPESSYFRKGCVTINVKPDEYMVAILKRAKEITDRYGAGRVTMSLVGELDSCFYDFPADWSTREKCYENWKKFSNTGFHVERYGLYGHQPSWGDIPGCSRCRPARRTTPYRFP